MVISVFFVCLSGATCPCDSCQPKAKKQSKGKGKGKGKGKAQAKTHGKARGKGAGKGKRKRKQAGADTEVASVKRSRSAPLSPSQSLEDEQALHAVEPGGDAAAAPPDAPAPAQSIRASLPQVEEQSLALAVVDVPIAPAALDNAAEPSAQEHAPPIASPCGEAGPSPVAASTDDAPSASSCPNAKMQPAVTISRASSSRVCRTPAEILDQITPPGFAFCISYNDWRFKVECKVQSQHESVFVYPYSTRTYSKPFVSALPCWLMSMHMHKKWALVQKHLPCPSPQIPGQIEESVYELLAPIAKDMPRPKQY